MNTLETMRARRAAHARESKRAALMRASAEAADRHHKTKSQSDYNREKRATNDASRKTAAKHRKPWTAEELAIAQDTGISTREAARQLGRTIAAVREQRRLREDR